MSPHIRSHHAKRRLDELIRSAADTLDHPRAFFWRVIHAVRASSQLLLPSHCQGPHRVRDSEWIVAACAQLARHASYWAREPEAWAAPNANPAVQFRSLVNHLLVHYPVPNFMAWVWFEHSSKDWERQLYLHLARGFSVRRFETPFAWQMGKAEARLFMQAPDDLHPLMALRWARVRSLGGNERLTRILLTTVLVAPSDDEPFWDTVVRFFIEHDPLSAQEIREIVDFIHGQKFRSAEAAWGRGAGPLPLDPDFSLAGRSLSRLRRHMMYWRAERMATLPVVPASRECTWTATLIKPFRCESGDETWTIHELLTDRELRAEGGIMQHCVASYIQACARRQTSIWSMQVEKAGTRKRVLTIEVLPDSRRIKQANGKRNSPASESAQIMLNRWAIQEGLALGQRA